MKQIQLIGITPDALADLIDTRLNKHFKEVTTHLQHKEPKKYLSRNQLAEMLSVNKSTIHNWRTKGILEAVQIGGKVFFEREKVEKAIVKLNK
ncbi:MAG: helix-turn-helix domain-containing protein [Oceanihabitans sp.]|nr:helix-turn-helix domain-containing protein [Oceanihabitans sp.]